MSQTSSARRSILAVALLLALLFSGQPTPAQDALVGQAARTSHIESDQPFSAGFLFDQIHRSMRLLNPNPVVGEPLIFEVRLEGRPGKGAFVAEFAQPLKIGHDLKIVVYPEAGRPYEYDPTKGSWAMVPNVGVRLRDREASSILISAGYDPDSVSGAIFDAAGRYGLAVVMECRGTVEPGIRSEEIGRFRVNVRMPQHGETDLHALNTLLSLRDPNIFQSLHNLQLTSEAHRPYVESIVNQFPEARLRPYAMLVLANSAYYITIRDKDFDPRHLEEATRLYEAFTNEYPTNPYFGTAMLRLVECFHRTGQKQRSRELALRMYRDPRLTYLIHPASEAYQRLFGLPLPPVDGSWMLYEDPADATRPDSHDVEQEEAMQRYFEQMLREAMSQQDPSSEPGPND